MASSRCAAIISLLDSCIQQQKDISEVITQLDEEQEIVQQIETTAQALEEFSSNQKSLFDFVTKKKQEQENTRQETIAESNKANEAWGTSVDCAWTIKKSGGCMNHPTWRQNPQVLLKVANEGEMTVTLTQSPFDDQENEGIGFYVFNGSNYKELITTNGAAVARSSFSRNDSVSCSFSLPPTDDGYVILPCTFHPEKIMKFCVSIDARETGNTIRAVTEEDEYLKTTLEGKWQGKTAGGCRNFPTWVYNPQYFIELDKPTTINVLLTQSEHEDFDAVGVYVFDAPPSSSGSSSKLVPTELIEKGSFSNGRECSLRFKVERSCIVVPCTFHAEKEAPFTINFFVGSNDSAKISELIDTKETSIDGEWDTNSAGGSTSYSSWRQNPQFVIRASSKDDLTLRLVQKSSGEEDLNPIGLYVFKDTGKRRLLVRPEDVLVSSPCSKLEAIDLKISGSLLQEKEQGVFTCVVMPCTFYPNLCGKFSLSVAVSCDSELPTIGIYQPFFQQMTHGEWTAETSGGCLNNGKTWRNNPQIRCKALVDTRLMLVLNLPNGKDDIKHSIGFYITEAPEEDRKTFSLTDGSILKKAPFRKSFEAYCPFKVEAGKTYNIIPCTFHAGIESNFTFSVFSNQTDAAILSPVAQHPKLCVSGSWKGENAGGCLNNSSWWLNPRFAICATEEVKATLVLAQHSESDRTGNAGDIKPIGIYVSRSDENLDPLLSNEDDMIACSSFEHSIDVSVQVTLPACENPYILVPSTFYPDEEGIFDVFMYLWHETKSPIAFKPILSIEELEPEEEAEEEGECVVDVSGNNEESTETDVEPQVVENLRKKLAVANKKIAALEAKLKDANEPKNEQKQEIDEPAVVPPAEIDEPAVESNAQLEEFPSGDVPLPPPQSCDPPPPPAIGKKKTVVKKVAKKSIQRAATEPVDVFKQIQEGSFLRKVSPAEKTSYAKRAQTEMFKGFNMSKIVARRTALEFSDDDEEEDNWSDHEDEDDWW